MITNEFKKILLMVSLTVSLLLILFIFNQVIQLSQSVGHLNETAGHVFMAIMFSLILAGILAPVYLYYRLPAPLVPPDPDDGAAYRAYLQKTGIRLTRNPLLSLEKAPATEEEIRAALAPLDNIAIEKVKSSAKRAFYTTAISQNGSLDALFMFLLQIRMIWEVAHVYSQRPTLRDMGYLYTNVLVTAFVAAQLDEAEYIEMLEKAFYSGVGSVVTLLPGTTIIINSALSGASNTFLTLRTGIIAQRYCSELSRPQRQMLRNSAAAQATKLMGSIVADGTKDLAKRATISPFKKWFGIK